MFQSVYTALHTAALDILAIVWIRHDGMYLITPPRQNAHNVFLSRVNAPVARNHYIFNIALQVMPVLTLTKID